MEKQSPPQQVVVGKVATVTVVELEGLLTEQQASDLLNLKPKTLTNDRVTAELGIPFVRLGRMVRYRPADLLAYIEARLVRPAVVKQ